MNKKLVAILATAMALALCAFALAGCSSNSSSTANSSASTAKKTLVVGFDQAYPPYGFVADDGSYTGFDIDLATEVAKRNGWDLKLEAIDWDAKDALVNQGTITCIWNGFTYEGRENDYTWSGQYMLNEQVVVVKANSTLSELKDLAGKTVMTQADSAALEVLSADGDQAELGKSFKGGAAQTIGDYNNAFMQLESGMVDAVACDSSIADYQMSAKPGVYKKLGALSSEHYAVGFKKGNTEMADAVTKTLKELNADGTVKTLCEKYAKYGMSYSNWVLK